MGSGHLLHLDGRGLYFGVVLDLISRRVVGWATSDRLKRDLAVEALRRALVARNPAPGLVHHSDRGSQYCSVDYPALLRRRGIRISMSGRGNCYDNSMVETFFGTIKSELIWSVAWQSRQQAENAVARYTDGFNNPVRRHSLLGFQCPISFERKAREVSETLSTKTGQVCREFAEAVVIAHHLLQACWTRDIVGNRLNPSTRLGLCGRIVRRLPAFCG